MVTIENVEVLFRRPDLIDLFAVDEAFPILLNPAENDKPEAAPEPAPAKDQTGEEFFRELARDPPKMRKLLERMDKLLVLCALRPRLQFEPLLEASEELRDVRSFQSQNRILCGLALQAHAGFNAAARVKIAPFVGTVAPLKTSIESRGGTAELREKSSAES